MVSWISDKLLHLLTPRPSNNFRARLIHPSVITGYLIVILVLQLVFAGLGRFSPQVLGYATQITAGELLDMTNTERQNRRLPPLSPSPQLAAAAAAKAADMFTSQYWAHTSPTGRDPWSFILAAGYDYLYAGENLARDFADSRAVVAAWMNSPSHRENLLNPRYREIGFAVVNGKYAGYETTLVVQMFGTRQGSTPQVAAPAKATQAAVLSVPSTLGEKTGLDSSGPPAGKNLPADIFNFTKNISVVLTLVLLVILVTDALLVYRRRVVRLSGHSLAHFLLLLVLLAILGLVGRGVIL